MDDYPLPVIGCAIAIALAAIVALMALLHAVMCSTSPAAFLCSPSPTPLATESAALPLDLISTPSRFSVGEMREGWDGWVSGRAIWVDADLRMWISPDYVAATDLINPQADGDVHILREADHIILFRVSIVSQTWEPGVATDDGLEKRHDLLPVIMR